ncbi:MAG: universal stress protein, partial [Burkholderiales bacterium]|nr:universal stress protein [Burkholderiales bacterium]
SVPSRPSNFVDSDALKNYYDEEAQLILKPAVEELKKAGVDVQTRFAIGEPAPTIAKVAEDIGADLIIMGSHGRSALKGLLLGSVTNSVLALCTKPMLILRNKPAKMHDNLQVGVAIDGSRYGAAAVKYIMDNHDLFGEKPCFYLINVVSDYAGVVMPDMAGMALPTLSEMEVRAMQQEAFDEAVAPYKKEFDKRGYENKEVCLVGNPGDEIAAYAKKHHLDLIVMGTRGFGAFKAAVLGSTATRIAAISDTPLLVIQIES